MASRNFPADSKLQHFYEQQYDKEMAARIRFHSDAKSGRTRRSAAEESAARATTAGLPRINPFEFAIRQKRADDEALREIVARARARHETDEVTRSHVFQGRRNGSGRPGGCRTNNLTSKNFYVHIYTLGYINFRERA